MFTKTIITSVIYHSAQCRMVKIGDVSKSSLLNHHTTTILQPFFQDHPGEPVPEETFWTLWCKGR